MPTETFPDRPTVLLAAVTPPANEPPADLRVQLASDSPSLLAALRASRIDLILLGVDLPDMPWPALMRRVRAARPQQKWALVAPSIEPSQEIQARALGALALLECVPDYSTILNIVQRGRPHGRVPPPAPITAPHRPRTPGQRARSPTAGGRRLHSSGG